MKRSECIELYEFAEKEYANSNIGVRELSKKYDIDRSVLTGWLLAKGYKIENRRASKSFNIHYFDEIDTEEKAYWLGFLFADGAITQHNKSYSIELSLKLDDKEHVKKFSTALGKNCINNCSTYRSRCIIGSKHMFNILESYGCTQRKSLTLKFPNLNIFKNENLIRHFIRGYVEGDGCLSFCDKNHTQAIISILGTKNFLNGIQQCYKSKYKLSTNSKTQEITKILSYSGSTAYKFAKWLYDGATIYLDRKYLRYKEYCRLYEKSNRLLQTNIGEDCNVNTEISTKTKEFVPS